jgi:hypothetical protein
MNDLTLTQLKIIVERAVRPVRASLSRKPKLREELLAHVSAVFEEERTRLGEERAALEQTAQRFGNPHELTVQLQQSVPASDAIHSFLDKIWFRPGETWLRRVRRYLVMWSLILMVLLPIWYVWVQVCTWAVRASKWPHEEARLFGGPVLLLDVVYFAFSFLILVWGLVSVDRKMTARIRAHQEWTSLNID